MRMRVISATVRCWSNAMRSIFPRISSVTRTCSISLVFALTRQVYHIGAQQDSLLARDSMGEFERVGGDFAGFGDDADPARTTQ